MISEIDQKIDRLLRVCAEQELGGILINTQPNFAWLTAGGTNGVDSSRESGVATLFIRRDGRRFLFANRIEMGRMVAEELNGQMYEPVEYSWEDEKGNPGLITNLAESLNDSSLPLGGDYAGPSLRTVEQQISKCRYRLTAPETDRLRQLGADVGEAIGNLACTLRPGLTEREVARLAADSLARARTMPVVLLVAADVRLKNFRHPVPTDVVWKNELMIVVCARRGGLIISLTRLVCDDEPSEELRRRTRACAEVNAALLRKTIPGVTGKQLYEVAASTYLEQGFPGEERLHHQGGATGYRTRDWVAHPLSNEVVEESQAFAWNPSITGAKVEETCIAFGNRIEIVTSSPAWPTIAIQNCDHEFRFPDVLSV